MMYQLPTGDWVDPRAITDITAIPRSRKFSLDTSVEHYHSAEVRIGVSQSFWFVRCHTDEAAVALRDKIANEVNDACAK